MSTLDNSVAEILFRIREHYDGNVPPVGSKGYELYSSITYAYILYSQEPHKYGKIMNALLDKFTAAEALLSLSQS